jgi:CBS domain-containing protein
MPHVTAPVKSYMTAPVYSAHPHTLLPEAEHRMSNLRVSSLPVLDDDARLIGVVSRTDLLRLGRVHPAGHHRTPTFTLPSSRVGEVMSRDPVTVVGVDDVRRAARLMTDHRVHRVFVVENERLVGVLSTRDLMDVVRDARVRDRLGDYMSRAIVTVHATDPIGLAAAHLENAAIAGVVVVDDDWPVGLFTLAEALQSRELERDTPVEQAMDTAMICLPVDAKLHRAAAQAAILDARRIIAVQGRDPVGILTGLDFARVAAA